MRVRNQTTVVLTKIAQDIKDDLAPIYGLKNILSAGLLLFGKLSDAQQKEAITKAVELKMLSRSSKKESLQNVFEMLKEITDIENQQPGTVYRVLSHAEQAIIDDFRKTFSPELKLKKKLKKA